MLQTTSADRSVAPARAEPRSEFEKLLMPLLSLAYGTAVRLTRDRSTAEDLVQDAALSAFRAFGSFEHGSNFKAWFLRILTNAFYSRYRREKHELNDLSLDDAPALFLYNRTRELGLQDGTPDPASLLLEHLDTEIVGRALEALPTEYRMVATLYFIDDLSYGQIAGVLDRPLGTVRSRLHRARRMLQRALWSLAVEQGAVEKMQALRGARPA
jgi:RNA polymerase sigma-70 factor (ECF subfamily)